MIKKIFYITLFCFASQWMLAQNIYIEDDGFRQCLNDNYPFLTTADRDSLNAPNANSFGGILTCQNYGIIEATQLEYFQSTPVINLPNNEIEYIPQLSSLSNVTDIYLYGNNLKSLPDLSALTSLQMLNVSNNDLVDLPAMNEGSIVQLHFAQNHISSIKNLDLFTNLVAIYAYENEISSLPGIPLLTNLEVLHIGSNDLTTLPDLSNQTALEKLYIEKNDLSTLPDLTDFPLLNTLIAYSNNFEEIIDLSFLTNLQRVQIYDNRFTFEDLEPQIDIPDFENIFSYRNQKPFDQATKYTLIEGSSLELSTDVDINSTEVVYNLLKGVDTIQTTTDGVFQFDNLKREDSGDYIIEIRHLNPLLGDLILVSAPINIIVQACCNNISFSPNGDGIQDELYISEYGEATVFDSNGRPVRSLVTPNNWDGRDDNGQDLAFGYYVIKVNESSSIRVTLLR